MVRLVLKRGPAAVRNAAEIAALPGVRVLDEVAGAGLLVDVDDALSELHREALRGWTIAPLTEHPLPGPVPPIPRPED